MMTGAGLGGCGGIDGGAVGAGAAFVPTYIDPEEKTTGFPPIVTGTPSSLIV